MVKMKASEANLLKFMGVPQQLIIPIYQRNYSWSRKDCQQLWDDILRVASDSTAPAHFIGSIVYISKGIYQATVIPQLLVIDGQQRLTTISLLISALAKTIENMDGEYKINAQSLYNYFLVNSNERNELRYKLVLTRSDKEALFNIIDGYDIPENSTHRIYDNYRFFETKIREANINFDVLYEGISKLLVVDVSLDRNNDNPQLIFESLNSTGVDLSQADLIRNFILMGLEPEKQNRLYNQYWYSMEQDFGQLEYSTLFDRFMRDYLTIKSESGLIPVIREVYKVFKWRIGQLPKEHDIEEIVSEIRLYSRYFVQLAFPAKNVDDEEIRAILMDINTLKVDVAYPFLMEVYDDYKRHQLLTRLEFIEILKIVESYVFRRAICGIPTNSLNKTFATLKRSIHKSRYLESVKAAFLRQTSYRRFPDDYEFWKEFTIKDVYNLRTRRNYLLSQLENFGRKEWVNIENYTIEHIMPQNSNLSKSWQEMLGSEWKSIQNQYLHTIGNLTITGYNSELSDRPFLQKRDMEGGFKDSPFRLNRSLGKLEQWGKSEIDKRAEELADLALKIWPMPSLPEDILDTYREFDDEDHDSEYTLEQFEYLKGAILQLFETLQTRILNLDSSVRQEIKKNYVAYKTTTNFVDIVPQKSRLRLAINMKFDEISDPDGLCRDVTGIGRWGNGDVEFDVATLDDIDYAIFLIDQSFKYHSEDFDI